MNLRPEVGSVYSLDLTDKRFSNLARGWFATLLVVHNDAPYEALIFLDGKSERIPKESVFVVSYSKLHSSLPTNPVADGIASVHRVYDSFFEDGSVISNLGQREMSRKEKRLNELICLSLGDERFSNERISQFIGHDVYLNAPEWCLIEPLQRLLEAPFVDYNVDCDIELATHCLHYGEKLPESVARCAKCKSIRLGCESIADFVMDWCEPVSTDSRNELFGQFLFEPELTDVQGPDGKWYPAFEFVEYWMRERGEI